MMELDGSTGWGCLSHIRQNMHYISINNGMTRKEIHENVLKIREFHKVFFEDEEEWEEEPYEEPIWHKDYVKHKELVFATIKAAKEEYGMKLDLLKYLYPN